MRYAPVKICSSGVVRRKARIFAIDGENLELAGSQGPQESSRDARGTSGAQAVQTRIINY